MAGHSQESPGPQLGGGLMFGSTLLPKQEERE